MKRPTLRLNDPPRKAQPLSGRPPGWLSSVEEQIARVQREIKGLQARLTQRLGEGEPAAAVGRKIFAPEPMAFLFDYLQDGVSSVSSQYVLRDAVTYEIPISFPPPGLFLARFMSVRITQRVFVADVGVLQIPMLSGNFFLKLSYDAGYAAGGPFGRFQTPKYAFPIDTAVAGGVAYETGSVLSRRINFFWNLIDKKSGRQFSDELMPDQLLLPQGIEASASLAPATLGTEGNANGYLEFLAPWLFERDGEAAFLFRPITPVIQPTAASGYSATGAGSLEKANTSRDTSVTVQVELHGTRYYGMRDLLGKGARV